MIEVRGARWALAACCLVQLTGCSLIDRSSRPDPAADNVYCALQYEPRRTGGDDLLFVALSSPWKWEEFSMSLPDLLFHYAFAPGRHLSADMVLEGADCQRPLWRKGKRLPLMLSHSGALSCTRRGGERVVFAVETKWGRCQQEIPAGDRRPRRDRCDLRALLERDPCACAQPARASRCRRATGTPAGGVDPVGDEDRRDRSLTRCSAAPGRHR